MNLSPNCSLEVGTMKKGQRLTLTLFIIYLILLTWIILFKMQLFPERFPHIRSINLIPFSESVIVNGKIDFDEIINNLIVFIPLGLYTAMLKPRASFWKKALFPLCVSLVFETLQFAFAIGAYDITDIIMNTGGGILGLLLYLPLARLLGEHTNKVLNIFAVIATFMIGGLIFLLVISTL